MGLPQIILIDLYVFSLGASLAQHGEIKTKKENFWTSLVSVVIVFALLIWGGFFS